MYPLNIDFFVLLFKSRKLSCLYPSITIACNTRFRYPVFVFVVIVSNAVRPCMNTLSDTFHVTHLIGAAGVCFCCSSLFGFKWYTWPLAARFEPSDTRHNEILKH